MTLLHRIRVGATICALGLTIGACGSAGGIGDVLGGVLNAPNNQQAYGTVQSVDTRNQQIILRQSDGSTVALTYDNRTQVSYQDQSYPVTALEYGDQVTARVQNNGNTFYTDLIEVTQSASNNTSGGYNNNGSVYSIQGTVRQVDPTNGVFTVSTNNGIITVEMPYNARSTDRQRFRYLRSGDYVTLQGVLVSNNHVQLRQFTN